MSEVQRRLYKAYKTDKYIADIQKRITDFLAYSTLPFNNEVPSTVKVYQEMIKMYTENNYQFLLPQLQDTSRASDLSMAMGWAMMAQNKVKILSTKAKSKHTVLELIDYRLYLYHDYQEYWINAKDWTVMSPMDIFLKLGILMYPTPPMTFEEWLYTHGHEVVLSDREFLNVIADLDK